MEAESSLLGACLVSAHAFPAAVDEGVVEADFDSVAHRAIWAAMTEASATLADGQHLDAILVSARVKGAVEPALPVWVWSPTSGSMRGRLWTLRLSGG
jgi:replicative DNA helicase